MIVVDTNLIAYLYLGSEHSKVAEAILNKQSIWAAPLLWRSEFRNVLAMYIRKKIISNSVALQIMEQAEELMNENEYAIPSEPVLDLVGSSQCSAYDCEFVYLAKELGTLLVTADKKILSEFPKLSISPVKFLE